MTIRRVIIETPYAADTAHGVARNVQYARRCMRDSLLRGEAPMMSHLLYTQALDDKVPEEREIGIEAGFRWGAVVEGWVVYTDRGVSGGMEHGINRAAAFGIEVEYRMLWGGKCHRCKEVEGLPGRGGILCPGCMTPEEVMGHEG